MPQLLWHEPPGYRRAKYNQLEKLDPWKSVRFAVFAFLTILGMRYWAGFSPEPGKHPPEWPLSIAMAFSVALFVAYILPRLVGLLANSIVILSEKGVNNNTVWGGVTIRFWQWNSVAFCYIWTESINNRNYPVLSFCDSQGIVLTTLCCSDKVSLPEIEQFLHTYQIPIQHEQRLS